MNPICYSIKESRYPSVVLYGLFLCYSITVEYGPGLRTGIDSGLHTNQA